MTDDTSLPTWAAQCRDAGLNGIRLKKSLSREPARSQLAHWEATGRIVRRQKKNTTFLIWAEAIPDVHELVQRLRNQAAARGSEGIAASEINKEVPPWVAPGLVEQAVQMLQSNGEWVARTKGKKTHYYAADCAPPDAQTLALQKAKADLEQKLAAGEAWAENLLLGKRTGKTWPHVRRLLDEGVRQGHIERLEIWTSPEKKIIAYRRRPATRPDCAPPPPVETLDWPAIAATARRLSSRHLDGAVTFEEVADELGVTPLVIKTAIRDRLQRQTGEVLLIPGEPGQVRDYPNARLEWQGGTYLRFRLQHAVTRHD